MPKCHHNAFFLTKMTSKPILCYKCSKNAETMVRTSKRLVPVCWDCYKEIKAKRIRKENKICDV